MEIFCYNNLIYILIVITGCARGDLVIIPRITFIQTDYPFEFKIIKFPLEVCFDMSDMTINKSKGQSLSMAGIGLRGMFFTRTQVFIINGISLFLTGGDNCRWKSWGKIGQININNKYLHKNTICPCTNHKLGT
ncbi:ATP-dependent DNA helicase PIF1-like [Aphis craccivora]|uniref:ATP-dependent DNA helicase PIF1-like n=1 Tax=Aphis craccivora TaxID=307492 RepID=A0A6G0XCU2_APHCR|nr:ATP-dependent DNA helicase PIF1-like [Aphis craccivora]